MFIWIVTIAAISILLAVSSLRELRKNKEERLVKKELKKGRVVYQRDSSVSSKD